MDWFIDTANDHPYLWALYAFAIVMPFVICAAFCVRSKVSYLVFNVQLYRDHSFTVYMYVYVCVCVHEKQGMFPIPSIFTMLFTLFLLIPTMFNHVACIILINTHPSLKMQQPNERRQTSQHQTTLSQPKKRRKKEMRSRHLLLTKRKRSKLKQKQRYSAL